MVRSFEVVVEIGLERMSCRLTDALIGQKPKLHFNVAYDALVSNTVYETLISQIPQRVVVQHGEDAEGEFSLQI